MKRLYRLFMAFAGFALVAISLALYLDFRVTSDYANSLADSERFVQRIASYNALHAVAGIVGEPASQVFGDGQLETNARQLETAVSRFGVALRNARRETMTESPVLAQAILVRLDSVEKLMGGVVANARGVFSALRAGQRNEAEVSMARSDRDYAIVRREFSAIDELIRGFQQQEFHRQARYLAMLRIYESVVAILIALSVIAVTLYLRRLLREVIAVSELQQRESEELRRLSTAFEHAIAGIAFVGKDKRFAYVNRTLAMALGYEPDQIVGTSSLAFLHPDDVEAAMRANATLRDKGKSELEIRAVRKDGSTIEIRLLQVSSFDQNGAFLGHYAFAQDITEQKRAQSALRRSEERFLLAGKATKDVIFEWDFKTGASWVNEAFSEQFGLGVWGDVDVSVWSNAVHPDDRDRALGQIEKAVASGEQSWTQEYRLRKGNGPYADVLTRAYIVRSATGEALRAVGVTMDVTERKRAERSYNTQILNSAAEGIFGMDVDGIATFVNASAALAFGWSPDELVGKSIHEMVHHHRADGQPYPIEECPTYKTRRTGETGGTDREVFFRKDGSTFVVEYATTPIRDAEGKVAGAVMSFRDVSERRAVEKMKDEFVSIVSHELRTPLTSIRGALGLLAGGRVGEIPEKGKRMLAIAVSNTDRLVRLINDILDIERMESGKITLTRQLCDSYQLMTQSIESIRPIADKAEVTLKCAPCDLSVWADPDRLLQTFSNLLSNAVKYSPAGGVVSLSATVVDENVVFEVADEGRGIPADNLELIFERFQQVDASDSREKGGSGLGLAICRSIVRQHGGEIHAVSALGKGSRFQFTIPGPAMVLTTPSAGRTVVVCDDEESVREIMCTVLEQKGYRAVGISSGRDLLSQVSEIAPDVIFLDLLMPDMNGIETLAALKADPRASSIPVVIISLFSPEESEWPFADLVGWVQKPYDERTIVNAVEHAFRLSARRQILLIEDNVDLARVVAEGFERHGIETIHASSGAAAIAVARQINPDLVILDLALPDMDGVAVVASLRTNDRLRTLPMIVYSAQEPTAAQRELLTLGPTEFLTKSRILPDEFERRVLQLLDKMVVVPKGALPNAA